MVREWFPHLTALQRLALVFVYDRTLGWGKEWERITTRQCATGIVGEDGTRYAAPFTSCHKRAGETLRSLVRLGVLRTEEGGRNRTLRYALCYEWNPEKDGQNLEMKLPKRLKVGAETPPKVGAFPPPKVGAETPPQRDNRNKRNQKEELAFADAKRESPKEGGIKTEERKTIEESIVRLSKKAKARSAVKMTDGRAMRKDGTGFLPRKCRVPLFWRELWSRHFPDVPVDPLPVVSQQVLWQYWKAWTECRPFGEFADFLGWVFENWNAIRLGTFAWMTGFPKAPAVRMVTSSKLRPLFEEAYREKEAVALWRKLEPHERKLRELVENGMDPDKAREVVERQYATKKELAELKASRERMAVMIETFNRRAGSRRGAGMAQEAPEAESAPSSLPGAVRPGLRKRGGKDGATGSFARWKEDEE